MPNTVAKPAIKVIVKLNVVVFIILIYAGIDRKYVFIFILCYNMLEVRSEVMNYDLEMEKIIKNINPGEKLLLHACCAPCSSAVLERLGNLFQISILFYNPNITSGEEYTKRLVELEKFVGRFKTKYKIDVIAGRYESREFFDIAKGLEAEPERGKRCYKCYELRLEECAKVAEKMGINYFTTTLSLSPYKNALWINEIGKQLEEKYDGHFLYADFKKKNGYKRSIELSKEFALYRQDYCGCVYSFRDKIKDA